MKVIITAKGASLKTNSWKAGQVVECHENIAAHFIKNGIATDPEEEPKPKAKAAEAKPNKTKS